MVPEYLIDEEIQLNRGVEIEGLNAQKAGMHNFAVRAQKQSIRE